MKFLFFPNRIKVGLQITLLLAILLFNFGPGGTSVTYAAPPANDDFASATLITGISYTNSISLSEATQDVTDPDNIGPCDGFQLNKGNNTVWYKYTPGVNESLSVDTIGSTFAPGDDLDTFIAVWTGAEGNLNLVECDDDNLVGQTSELSFVATAGTTYFFEVAVFNCFEGTPDPPGCGQQIGGNLVFNINITNTNVVIGGSLKGRYYVYPDSFTADEYGINSGPVQVVSTTGAPIFSSQRAIYLGSFNSIIGYPGNQLTTDYWFTTYDDVGMITYLVIGNPHPSQTAQVDVYISGNKMNATSYSIGPGQRIFPRYGVNSGPVHVVSTNGVNIFASERTKFKESFNEVMGYPGNQVHTEFWFTSYDDVGMLTYLVIGNPHPSQTAQVDVYIGGVKRNTTPYQIGPGQRLFPRYGINSGPVRVVSTNGVSIFTSERTKFGDTFNEVMGFPGNQVHTEFWFTSYDDASAGMLTYLVIGNPHPSQTAQVDVYIAGVKKNTYSIGPGQRIFPRYGINSGAVQVVSTNGVNIFASERSKYLNSFNEILGIAGNKLTTDYWFTSYDDLGMSTTLVIGAP